MTLNRALDAFGLLVVIAIMVTKRVAGTEEATYFASIMTFAFLVGQSNGRWTGKGKK